MHTCYVYDQTAQKDVPATLTGVKPPKKSWV